jgi:hypothetical protein
MEIPAARQGVGDMSLDRGVQEVQEGGIVLSEHSVPVSRQSYDLLGDRVHDGSHGCPSVAQSLREHEAVLHWLTRG